MDQEILDWLLEGDISIQYQTRRDLLGEDRTDLQEKIIRTGWAKRLIDHQNPDGYWGYSYYQPKWISTHYTLLDLRNLNITRSSSLAGKVIHKALQNEKGQDGGINPFSTARGSDVCVNGMFLNMASYFGADERELESIVDFLLSEIMPDGGFNCARNRYGAVHSSLHSTLSTCEGFREYLTRGYQYRLHEVEEAEKQAREFMLAHRLYKSDRTGQIINRDFLKMPFSPRWKYDILRALDYFRYSGAGWDDRLNDALEYLKLKRNQNGRWKLSARYSGKIYFEFEKAGQPSRWNTLRASRILKAYEK